MLSSYEPTIQAHADLTDDSIWDTIREGMRNVITQNTGTLFQDVSAAVAGKTGTAEEKKGRANHATFIGYAPYDNPEIGVTVAIPNGYGSAYASSVAADVFKYYFGDITFEDILSGMAKDATTVVIQD